MGNDIAVLGAGGFLGRAIVRALEAAGLRIHGYDKDDVWLTSDRRFVPEVSTARAIVYLINRINPRVAAEEPAKVAADMETMRAFLDALRSSGATPRVVLPSSGGTVYDTSREPPYGEDSPTAPASEYGKAKLAMERLMTGEAPPGADVVIARISNVYGPGQPAGTGQGVVAHWLDAALRGDEVVMLGAESVTRDFVYIDDVASAFVRLVEAEHPPAVVNVGAGAATSLGELARTISGVVGTERFRVRHEAARSFDVAHNWLDVDRARTELGWKPHVSLREGIARTWESMSDTARG
jgi:UDP-glucose 4-epimerase